MALRKCSYCFYTMDRSNPGLEEEFQSRVPVLDRVPDPSPFFLVVGMSANQHACFTTPHEYCIGRTIVLLIYYHTYIICIMYL